MSVDSGILLYNLHISSECSLVCIKCHAKRMVKYEGENMVPGVGGMGAECARVERKRTGQEVLMAEAKQWVHPSPLSYWLCFFHNKID